MKTQGSSRRLSILAWMLACACVLVFALAVHQGAYAAELAAGEQATPQAQSAKLLAAGSADVAREALHAQGSSKTTMYVVSKIDGRIKYSYNKNGLVKSETYVGEGSKTTYKYSGAKMKSFATGYIGTRAMSGSMEYSGGKLKRVVSYGTHGGNTFNYKFSYNKKGRMVKRTGTIAGQSETLKFTYNKKGKISKATTARPGGSSVETYAYDKKGNLIKRQNRYSTYVYELTYNEAGCVVSRTTGGGIGTRTYEYKRITAPKKYVKAIKKQQHALVNGDFGTFVFPSIG